ncbi:MAG: TIGR03032 family protein, partial [Planctomycetales bacterium]|nr:TIGR03032 family protein [Planctomycetales bacterium]
MAREDQTSPSDRQTESLREVRYRHTPNFASILQQAQCALLVSTYQAGKLIAIGVADERLTFSFHGYDQAMGIAASPRRLAVGSKGRIWLHEGNRSIAPTLTPEGQFDRCYLARSAMITGGIHCHEIAWDNRGELWVVNTLFSCLCTLHPEFSFVPRWRPGFVSALVAEDRCHLNGLAMRDGQPAFVTVMAESDRAAGWRENKGQTGCVIDIAKERILSRGLSMPHSPRWHAGALWVLNSGMGTLELVDIHDGQRQTVSAMPGYTRGLALHRQIAFVGLSRIRETAVFGGVPIAEHRSELKCGVGVVDMNNGQTIATLEFESGVEEIFDVQVLPETRCAAICGPHRDIDGDQDIWIVPPPDKVTSLTHSDGQRPAMPDVAAPRNVSPADSTSQLVARALVLHRERRIQEAIQLLDQASAQNPVSGEILNHLGNALQDAGQQELALQRYAQAVSVEPTFYPALQNLGYVLVALGHTDLGIERLKQAQEINPLDVNHILIATALPTIYTSVDDLRDRRTHLEGEIKRLADNGLRIDTSKTLVPTNFFAAYQGYNDCLLHKNLGRIYRGGDLSKPRRKVTTGGGKIRIGFLSAYFRDHTIGRLNLGRVERLPRDRFEIVVLSVGQHHDEMARRFAQAADQFVLVPRDVAAARELIARQEVDILFFTDVGMDALTYTLAFSRMAPVQAVTWGHPVTTGSRTMDYFVSSQLLELPEADGHYTERLLRPASMATYYHRPILEQETASRREWGLEPSRHLYLCPQTLFKFHPEFDPVLAGILRADPLGDIVLIEGRTSNWTRMLQARFAQTMPDAVDRIRFLPAMENPRFLHLLAAADVMLDPLHFGGGNTSYEAFALGTPIVTLPGPYLRSRITFALYQRMGLPRDGVEAL